jgi:hypothetical protein
VKAYYEDSIIRAGTPTTVQLSGTSFVTTAPAPIFTLSPILIPPMTIAPAPIKQFLPITGTHPVSFSPIVTRC